MGDMKDKMKDFMKKVNNPFSSSGKFKGQGRVLGSSSSGTANLGSSHPLVSRLNPNPSPAPSANSKPSSQKAAQSERPVSKLVEDKKSSASSDSNPNPNLAPSNGFDPFDSLITSGKRNKNGYSLKVFECPVCNRAFGSEEEVSEHIESCVNNPSASGANSVVASGSKNGVQNQVDSASELETRVGTYVSGKPPSGSVEVVLRLLQNIIKEPENAKFRRIRMSNPKIREAVGEVAGCVELIECVGFKLVEEEGEMWAVLDVPSEENIQMMKKVISLIELRKVEDNPASASVSTKVDEQEKPKAMNQGSDSETKPVDRQTRVFFSVPESVAAKIQLPESFYNLSVDEVKREAELRRKKIAESQLLIPKSYKEKQAKAARTKYTKSIIRIQFPDGVVLQGVFSPREPTSVLYEFVSSALKQPGLEFELLHPVPVKRRVIPCFPPVGEKAATLDDEDLVPSALVKFRPIETDSMVFTGLRNELLEISEPLESSR